MHDINKPITLEDLTNPDKTRSAMKSFDKKDSLNKKREAALKKNLKKRKYISYLLRKKWQYYQTSGLKNISNKRDDQTFRK